MEAATAAKEAASLWNGWNIGKVFSNDALPVKIHFTNNSKEPLTLI
jgi:hypothetical protein